MFLPTLNIALHGAGPQPRPTCGVSAMAAKPERSLRFMALDEIDALHVRGWDSQIEL